MKDRKGQAALFLIILSAIAIIFFAISLNWGRISQIKTFCEVAVTTTASQMASSYASYGEMLEKSNLDGELEKCEHDSVFVALVTLVVVIVISWISMGSLTGEALAFAKALATAAIIMSSVNVVLQAAVVQPGLTDMWTKYQRELGLSTVESVLAGGLDGGLRSSINDQAIVTDYLDENENGRFGYDVDHDKPNDTIPRFNFYNTERNRGLKSKTADIDLSNFVDGLKAFLPKINGAALYYNPLDPRYNPCCQPVDFNGKPVRPYNLTLGSKTIVCTDRNPTPAACNGDVWTGAPDRYGNTYSLSYEYGRPNYLNSDNFLNRLGIDEEVRPFSADKAEHKPPHVTQATEATGLFRGFWEMTYIRNTTDLTQPLVFDFGPAGIDYKNRTMDKVDKIDKFQAPDNFCAGSPNTAAGEGPPEYGIYWKPGKDTYCQSTWPYTSCAKFECAASKTGGDCCPTSNPTDWPQDALDDTIDQLMIFNKWSQSILKYDATTLASSMNNWYDNMTGPLKSGKYWLGPPCDGTNEAVCSVISNNADVAKDGGMLYEIKRRLDAWDVFLKPWLYENKFADNGSWCVPGDASSVSPHEAYVITGSGTVGWGTIGSVVNCLNYYGNGNAEADFNSCQDRINFIKDAATNAQKYANCKTDFDTAYSNAVKAQQFMNCRNAIGAAVNNAAIAAEFAACAAAVGRYICPPSNPKPSTCGSPNTCAPPGENCANCPGDCGACSSPCSFSFAVAEPAFDKCVGGNNYYWWADNRVYAYGGVTNCGGISKPASCFGLVNAPTVVGGEPAFDACGAGYVNWITNNLTYYGSPWSSACLSLPPSCQALPSSPFPTPDPCQNPPVAYDNWLTNTRNSFNGGMTRAQYCAGPGLLPPSPECTTMMPRSYYAKPRYDVCDNDNNWNAGIGGPYIDGTYQKWIIKSVAANQTEQQGDSLPLPPTKFKQRAKYLKLLNENISQGESAIAGFSKDIDNFLKGPVKTLIDARNSLNSAQVDSIPNSIIYGWKDPIPVKGKLDGYWHAVQLKIKAPGKMPTIGTRTSGFMDSTRCYFLQDYTGCVQVDVNRWDEDHAKTSFANKLPIWKVSFRKPGTADVTNPQTLCIGDPWLKLGFNATPDTYSVLSPLWTSDTKTQDMLKGAFMISGEPAVGDATRPCYDHMVNDIFPSGMSTTMCAYYGIDTKMQGNLGVRFVDCSDPICIPTPQKKCISWLGGCSP